MRQVGINSGFPFIPTQAVEASTDLYNFIRSASWYRVSRVFGSTRRSRMEKINRRDQITRRGFLELSSASLAAAGLLGDANAANASSGRVREVGTAKSDSAQINGKIALEEHFGLSETSDTSYAALRSPEFQQQIQEIGDERVAEMDRGAVELCILSLVAHAPQKRTSVGGSLWREEGDRRVSRYCAPGAVFTAKKMGSGPLRERLGELKGREPGCERGSRRETESVR
jgi:hypothetical protein